MGPPFIVKGYYEGPHLPGGIDFLAETNSKSFIRNTPFFVTSKAPPLDVTISLRRFMGKMASVRQILPCQPGKHPLSGLYDPRPSPSPLIRVRLSSLRFRATGASSKAFPVGEPHGARWTKYPPRGFQYGFHCRAHSLSGMIGRLQREQNAVQYRSLTSPIFGVAPAAKFLMRIRKC